MIVADTCFWIGLCNSRDQHHLASVDIWRLIESNPIIIPWPCMYETLKSEYVRNKPLMETFERILRMQNITRFDDNDYREMALKELFIMHSNERPMSLTDIIIRHIVNDLLSIKYLITFNVRDFSDVSRMRKPLLTLVNNSTCF